MALVRGEFDRCNRRDGRVRDRHHLVTRSDPARPQRDVQRFGAAAHANGVTDTDKRRELLFESRDLGAENVAPLLQHLVDRGADFGFVREVLRARIPAKNHFRTCTLGTYSIHCPPASRKARSLAMISSA